VIWDGLKLVFLVLFLEMNCLRNRLGKGGRLSR
jgi:hypothetical protein